MVEQDYAQVDMAMVGQTDVSPSGTQEETAMKDLAHSVDGNWRHRQLASRSSLHKEQSPRY